MPWVKEYYDGQQFYNNGTPQQLQEVTVTASNRPEDRMRANLRSSIEQRQAKEQKDKEILDSLDAKIKEFEEAAKV